MPPSAAADLRVGDVQAGPLPPNLLALAPLDLANHRAVRYKGDDQYVNLAELAPRDQDITRGIYDVLTDLLLLISKEHTEDTQRWRDVRGWTVCNDPDKLIDQVRELGTAPSRGIPTNFSPNACTTCAVGR